MATNDLFSSSFDFEDAKAPNTNPALVFITKIGELNEAPVYEFFFSDEPDSACGPYWETICQYNVQPPEEKWVSLVGRFQPEELVLTLLEELDNFRYLDGVFGVVGLGWEYIEDYRELPDFNTELLVFRYGETLESVEAKMKSRGLELLLT